MTFHDAVRRQYLHASIYTVWLVGPGGTREELGSTARHTGAGLVAILGRLTAQVLVRRMPGAETVTFRKHADRLEFSNGWRVEFGGTIRQEAE